MRNIKSKLWNLQYKCFKSVSTPFSCFNSAIPCYSHDKNIKVRSPFMPVFCSVSLFFSFMPSDLDPNSSASLTPAELWICTGSLMLLSQFCVQLLHCLAHTFNSLFMSTLMDHESFKSRTKVLFIFISALFSTVLKSHCFHSPNFLPAYNWENLYLFWASSLS